MTYTLRQSYCGPSIGMLGSVFWNGGGVLKERGCTKAADSECGVCEGWTWE